MLFFPQLPATGDTTAAVADSFGVSIDRIGEGITDTGRLILAGEWREVFTRAVEGGTDLAVGAIPSLLSAFFVGVTFYALYRMLSGTVGGVLRRSERVDIGLETILMKTLRVVCWVFIVLLVLSQLGLNLSALIAGLGIAGLAVGFAAKDSLENFISGITILLDRPFRIGDWVTVDGHFGQVREITLRSTRIRTLNEQTVILPSIDMVRQPVVNHSDGHPLRVDVLFGIAYKEEIDAARSAVMALLDGTDERLAPDGSHRVVATALNDSSVDMQLQLYIADPGQLVAIRNEMTERIRKALREADIEIPFPHLQVFLDGADALRDVPIRIVSDAGA